MGTRFYASVVAALIVICTAGAGSASAAPDCGSVITKDTKLKKDIHCDVGETGLEIDGDGITLNLDGHTIQGDDSDAAQVAVTTSGDEDVVVKGGTLSGFGHSLVASGGAGLLVDDMKIYRQESEPIVLTAYNGATAKGGIEFEGGSDHRADENSIEGTGGFALSARPGIGFIGVEGGLALGNHVSDTVADGIVVSGGHDIHVVSNDVRDSGENNVSVQGGATDSLVEKNESRGGFFGISADDNAFAIIRKNIALRAINDGIHNPEELNPVYRNTANHNGDYGIDSASGALSHHNVAKNNTNPAQCIPAEACNQSRRRLPITPLEVTVKARRNGPDINGGQVTIDKEGKGKTYFVRVKNTTPAKQKVLLDDRSDPLGNFKVRWEHAAKNVSSDAFGEGYPFKLDAEDHTTFELTVTPKIDNPGELCPFGAFGPKPPGNETVGFLYVNSSSICG
jgi:hypothetical protein